MSHLQVVAASDANVLLRDKKDFKSYAAEPSTGLVRAWEIRPLPTCNLTYVKIPKAASAASELVAKRISRRAGMSVDTYPHGSQCGLRYRPGFASTHRLQRPSSGPETFLFTVVRNPLNRIASEFRHFGSQNSTLRRYIQERHHGDSIMVCTSYASCDVPHSLRPDDISVLRERCAPCAKSRQQPEVAVATILRDYDFIGLSERFDESMVVLAMLLQVPLEDVLYISMNKAGALNTDGTIVRRELAGNEVRTPSTTLRSVRRGKLSIHEKSGGLIDEFWRNLFARQLIADFTLHEAVNASLDLTIEALGGQAAVQPVLTQFKQLNAELQARCPMSRLVGPSVSLPRRQVARMDMAIECINRFTNSRTMSQALLSTRESNLPTFETEQVCIDNYIKPEPLVIITTTSHKAYLDRPSNRNIWDRDPGKPLWVFHEDSWEQAHGRTGILSATGVPRYATCMTDIFKVEAWLWSALKKGGPLDQYYAFAGNMEPCDQPLRIKSGKVLIRKLAAVNYALKVVNKNAIVVWLDTDVATIRPPDATFMEFARAHDISFIPFTTNKGWGDKAIRNFRELRSPFWRIESGVAAYSNTAMARSIVTETIALYRGLLLKLVVDCLDDMQSRHICNKVWFQRNVYLDDIFVMSFVLHKHKYTARYGWFSMGCAADCPEYQSCQAERLPLMPPAYFFSHVCQGQTYYTATWNLERYFIHSIGNGAYSRSYRSGRSSIDPELLFEPYERFNDTVELRFPGATLDILEDRYWDLETLRLRQSAGMWPKDMRLTEKSEPPVPRNLAFLDAIRNADNTVLM